MESHCYLCKRKFEVNDISINIKRELVFYKETFLKEYEEEIWLCIVCWDKIKTP